MSYQPSASVLSESYSSYLDNLSEQQLIAQLTMVNSAHDSLTSNSATGAKEIAADFAIGIQQRLTAFADQRDQRQRSNIVMPLDIYSVEEHLHAFPQ